VVNYEDGANLAQEFRIPFIETSAKLNENVSEAFLSLTKNIKSRLIDTAPRSPHSGTSPPFHYLNPTFLFVVGNVPLSGSSSGRTKDRGCCAI